jgi:5-formyltetrahydrofolate cyclo-ligase
MTTPEEKRRLREKIGTLKKNYTSQQFRKMSEEIFRKIENLEIFQLSKVVMVFWSLDDEVNTHEFILRWYRRKTILLPVISDENLIVRRFTGIESLVSEERLRIYEPSGEDYPLTDPIDLIIVPGMAFDLMNNRLGRGKAYYDKFLANMDTYKIGVCFDFQLLEKVPVSESDVTMDNVITNN